ncbi:MAG: GxxExxY protein [Bacteroides sp.]|nr:GxxExxY protein [Bacteroides sp.]
MGTEDLIKIIIQCAYQVRLYFAPGFLESVYQKALVLELKEKGIHVETEFPIKVYYKNTIVGEFKADMIVENTIVVELKAVQSLIPAHEAQLVNYLTATRIDNGLLMNFGGERIEIKRKFRQYKQTTKKNNQND